MLHPDRGRNYILFNLAEKKMDWKIHQARRRCFIDRFGSLFTALLHFNTLRGNRNVGYTDTFLSFVAIFVWGDVTISTLVTEHGALLEIHRKDLKVARELDYLFQMNAAEVTTPHKFFYSWYSSRNGLQWRGLRGGVCPMTIIKCVH